MSGQRAKPLPSVVEQFYKVSGRSDYGKVSATYSGCHMNNYSFIL